MIINQKQTEEVKKIFKNFRGSTFFYADDFEDGENIAGMVCDDYVASIYERATQEKVVVLYDSISCFGDTEYYIINEAAFEKQYFQCDSCNRAHKLEDTHIAEKSDIIRDDNGNIVVATHTMNLCDYCASRQCKKCIKCGKFIYRYSAGNIYGTDSYVCRDCESDESNGFYRCPTCHRLYESRDDANVSESIYGDTVCCECVRYNNVVLRGWHSMKNQGDYIFQTTENDTEESPFIGFELEVDEGECCEDFDGERDATPNCHNCYCDDCELRYENSEGCAKQLYKTFKNLYRCEHDGSLCRGFEIISQPLSENWVMENLDKLKTTLEICVNRGFKSHDAGGRCGLHMHMSRSFFGKDQDASIAKLLLIFKKYWPELKKFSRRGSNEHYFQSYGNSYIGSNIIKIIKKFKYGDYDDHEDRYFAVNLTNRKTIEIRIWRGTLNWDTFFATLKFTFRLMHLCKDIPAKDIVKMSWEEILGDDPDIVAYWNKRNQ